jgi:hypothetical protein
MLPRELYLPAAGPDSAQWCSPQYVDLHGTREEILRISSASDTYLGWTRRVSSDNGRTWGPEEPLDDVVQRLPEGGLVTYPGGSDLDPATGTRYHRRMRRLWAGNEPFTFEWKDHAHPFTDHCFVLEEPPDGPAIESHLRFEEGPAWDPAHPFDPAFGAANRAYFGTGFAFAPDGHVFLPIVARADDPGPGLHEGGLVLMRRDPATGTWRASNRVHIETERSSRGLLEPDVAVLADGRLLIICRGSNTETTPGRKWVTSSSDGGVTLEPMRELTWEDGESFYSPSSIHRLQRSRRNGRLYWLANICDEPPSGNGPRHPLWLCEIDEPSLSVRRDPVLVDKRRPGDGERLQLSNFALLEDQETGRFEITLTRIGENDEHFWQGAVYRYLFEPPA